MIYNVCKQKLTSLTYFDDHNVCCRRSVDII